MTHENRQESTGTAIAYLLFGVLAGLGLDLCAKGLLSTYTLEQFVFVRSLVGLSIFVLLARQLGGLRSLFTSKWAWHLLRTLLATGAMFVFFHGLARMPLVDALTLGFTAPLMVTALSVPLLGEHVGWRRWVAVTIGFVGVLIILRPGLANFLSPRSPCYSQLFVMRFWQLPHACLQQQKAAMRCPYMSSPARCVSQARC